MGARAVKDLGAYRRGQPVAQHIPISSTRPQIMILLMASALLNLHTPLQTAMAPPAEAGGAGHGEAGAAAAEVGGTERREAGDAGTGGGERGSTGMEGCLQSILIPVRAVSAALRSVHGQADHVHPPLLLNLAEARFADVLRVPGQAMGADSL